MKYIVWVGGIDDIETTDKARADEVAQEWIDKGYDDIIIETITEDKK